MAYNFLEEEEEEKLSQIYSDEKPDLFLTGSTIRVTTYEIEDELITLLEENDGFEYRQVMSLDYYTLQHEGEKEREESPQARLISGENESHLTVTIGSPETEDEIPSAEKLSDAARLVGRTGEDLRQIAEQQLE